MGDGQGRTRKKTYKLKCLYKITKEKEKNELIFDFRKLEEEQPSEPKESGRKEIKKDKIRRRQKSGHNTHTQNPCINKQK